MFFEWFVFITILAFILSILGGKQGSFIMAFIGAILLLYIGASILFEGVQEHTNPDINAIGSNYKVTYEITTTSGNNSLSVYLLGWIFTIMGIGSALLAVYNHIYLPKQNQKEDGY